MVDSRCRRTWVSPNVAWLTHSEAWPKLAAVVLVESERTVGGETTTERRMFITSSHASAKKMGEQIRGHWGIENKVHWMLDVTYHEDGSRPRKGKAPENLSLLKKLTMNLLKAVSLPKRPDASVRRKRKRGNRSDDFLAAVLDAAFPRN